MSNDTRPRDESNKKTKARLKRNLKRANELATGASIVLTALGEPATASLLVATAFACKVLADRIKD